jgi:hypothetical protein
MDKADGEARVISALRMRVFAKKMLSMEPAISA